MTLHNRYLVVVVTVVISTALALVGITSMSSGAGAADYPPNHVVIGATSYLFTGNDVPRGTDQLVAYTKGVAPTNQWGHEVAVVNGVVTRTQSSVGGMAVPAGGLVLSGHGRARTWLAAGAKVGTSISQIPGRTWSTPTPTTPTPTPTTPTPTTPTPTGPTFRGAVTALPGLSHYYPLNGANEAKDTIGTNHGTNYGATFAADGATFGGSQHIELPDHNDFSVTTTGKLTIVAFMKVSNWRANTQGGQYVHWMGKGVSGAHEWTFRYYPETDGERPKRVSFYHFNPAGGLGAGSYFQDSTPAGTEVMVVGQVDLSNTKMYRDGILRDTDALSGYSIKPKNTTTPVRLGTRDKSTGYLDGKLRRVAFFNQSLTASQLGTLWSARTRAEG